MQEVLKMSNKMRKNSIYGCTPNTLKENQLTSYENFVLNMLLATAADVFDTFSVNSEFEVTGTDKNNRKFIVKVVVENEIHK